MKKQSKKWENIGVNRRSGDKVYFESPLIQSISDGMDFLKAETKSLLQELDSNDVKKEIDEFDLKDFGEFTVDQISEIADEVSQLKSKIIDDDDIPDFVKESSMDAKRALNRDEDYIRRAKRKLRMLDSDKLTDIYRTSIRVIELCDKALEVNHKNWQAYYVKAQALINLERYDDAIEELIKSLALNENNFDAWLDIAYAYESKGEYCNAIEVYDSLLKYEDISFEALNGKAHAYYNLEDYKNADEFFKKADSIKSLDDESKQLWDEVKNNL